MMRSLPLLSVVVVTAGLFRNLARTLRHLRAQTICHEIEVLVVAANPECLADMPPGAGDGFGRFQPVFTGAKIGNVDKASAHGVFAATSDLVALIEDHAYPEPEWAARIAAAHNRGHWAAAGPIMVNANPRGMLSWTNILIAYGPWSEPARPGERDGLPGHNLTFRREILTRYGDRLPDKLGRSGGLLEDLQQAGHRFYLSDARLAHANPSRLAPTVSLRFNAGRLYGWSRATENDWTPLHRIIYVLAGPLIPFLRFQRIKAELFSGGRRAHLTPRVWPALFFGLMLDAAGQMAGYALGPGKSIDILAVFEMDRMQHLTAYDRRLLAEPATAPPLAQEKPGAALQTNPG